MDCTDIVMGTTRGDQFCVVDLSTRDRGKPLRDNFYNGVDSLTAAVGMEQDGFWDYCMKLNMRIDWNLKCIYRIIFARSDATLE